MVNNSFSFDFSGAFELSINFMHERIRAVVFTSRTSFRSLKSKKSRASLAPQTF